MEDVLSKLIEFVEVAIPQVWAAAYRQVYVDIVLKAVWGTILLIAAMFLGKAAIPGWVAEIVKDTRAMNGFEFTFGIVAAGFSIIAAICFSSIIGPLMNPNYYAIKVLLALVE